jgi:hypothetical protein
MPSSFAEDAAMVSDTIAGVFGEDLRLEARSAADPNGRQAADATRPPFTMTGVFSTPSTTAKAPGRGISNTNFHDMVRQYPSAVLHGAMPWRPSKGDRLVRIDSGRSYEIVEVHNLPQGLTRLELVA